MKKVLVVLALICLTAGLFSCGEIHEETKNTFEIQKTPEGYDIYKNNKLVWEFTKQNCDSLSLETLKMIYEGD